MLADKLRAASVSEEPLFVEDVFSTYLYTGNGSTQTVTNGIDLAGEGGLVWVKSRSAAGGNHLFDTLRGVVNSLRTNETGGQEVQSNSVTGFNEDGFSTGGSSTSNGSGTTYASWTFRKAPKFFDVVTYTGDGASSRAIAHSLGQEVGMVMTKATSTTGDWNTYHRSATGDLVLNTTAAQTGSKALVNSATTTTFTVSGAANTNAVTYVAYLFAHDDSDEGIIQCGSFTHSSTVTNSVNLGFEPQYVMVKNVTTASGWITLDVSRGFAANNYIAIFYANSSAVEQVETTTNYAGIYQEGLRFTPSMGGFNWTNGDTIVYMAIRRGPMRVPTSGTEVYNAATPTPTGIDGRKYTGVGFPLDLIFLTHRTGGGFGTWVEDRLRGAKKPLYTTSTTAEDGVSQGATQGPSSFDQDGWTGGSGDSGQWDYAAGYTNIFHYMKRAPGFMDIVCYTGTGVAHTEVHNLGVAPELMIVKKRSSDGAGGTLWAVRYVGLASDTGQLSNTAAFFTGGSGYWNSSSPTATTFPLGTVSAVNYSAGTFVAYLFATLAGVSKVGSYTGTAATLQINCGFTAGARFVLIKRTDSTGDWYVWDTARGIIAGNDPYLLLNSAAAEVTSTDYIAPYSAGFEISSTAPAAINASGGTYIFLAIA